MLALAVVVATSVSQLSAKSVDIDGISVALLGDSMTWIGGDSCQNDRGWTHTLKELIPRAHIETFARSGATWTNSPQTQGNTTEYTELISDDNVIYNQALRLRKKFKSDKKYGPDIIVIYAGVNDAWFSDKRPGIFEHSPLPALDIDSIAPSDVHSLQGSIELVCKMLKSDFPDTKILFVGPTEISKVSAQRISRVADIIESTGHDLGVSTLRIDKELPIKHSQEVSKPIYTVDGVHTNRKGARLIGEYIFQNIKKTVSE